MKFRPVRVSDRAEFWLREKKHGKDVKLRELPM